MIFLKDKVEEICPITIMPILLATYFNPASKEPKILHTKVNKKTIIETIEETTKKINLQPTDQRVIKHQS